MSENASAAAAAAASAAGATSAAQGASATESAAASQSAPETAVQENTPSKRDEWNSRYKKRFAPDAETIDTESDEYYDNLTKMADEYDRMEGNERQMNDLLAANPSFEGMIRDAKEGRSFLPSLVEAIGVDRLKEALEDPAVAEEVGKANDEFMKRKQQEAEDSEASQRNIEESLNNIKQYAEDHGLSDEQVNEVITKIVTYVGDGMAGLFPTELIDMAFKAMNYDSAVQEAEETGRVQGRNENIQAQLERSQEQPNLPPNIGQSGTLPTDTRQPRRKGVMPLSGEEFEY